MLPSSGSCLEVLIKSYSSPRSLPHSCSCCMQAACSLAQQSHQVLCTFQLASPPASGQAALLILLLPLSLWKWASYLNTGDFLLSSVPSAAASPAAYPHFPSVAKPSCSTAPHSLHSAASFAVTHSHMFSAFLTSHSLLKQS